MVKTHTTERRAAVRAKRVLSIQYRLVKSAKSVKEPNTRWYLSTTHDMSVLGLSFLSEVAYGVDDVLEIHVVMSGVLDIFKGYAKVVRVERKSTAAYYLIAVKLIENSNSRRRLKTSRRVTAMK
jgi:hypothetical protein